MHSAAFLGMTVSRKCCYNTSSRHQPKDYYAIFGILSACRPGRAVIDYPKEQAQCAKLITLKNRIRQEISESWLGSPRTETRLASGNFPTQPNGDDALFFGPFMSNLTPKPRHHRKLTSKRNGEQLLLHSKNVISKLELESSQLSNLKQSETSDLNPSRTLRNIGTSLTL